MPIPDAERMAEEMWEAIQAFAGERERRAVEEGHVGVSDIGFCREHTRMVATQSERTDSPDKYTAFIGTWLGDGLEQVINTMFPTAERHLTVTVTLPSGVELEGHPDLVTPTGVIDIKTVDGLTSVMRNGPSEGQLYQRDLYAAGLIQAGRKIEWTANVWWDRSGRTSKPWVDVKPYHDTVLSRADEWLSDVLYAIRAQERAPQDMPVEFCVSNCEFFTACRGNDVMTDSEGGGLITDPIQVDAVRAYLDARDAKKEAEHVMDDMRRQLASTSGIAEGHVVRWTYVNESEVPGYFRPGYTRLDVRKIPRPRK